MFTRSPYNTTDHGSSSECLSSVGASGLAARRAATASLPKLKDINKKADLDSAELCAVNDGEPDLDFHYADCDSLPSELAEIYCYSELDEFAANADAYWRFATRADLSTDWRRLDADRRRCCVLRLLDELDLSEPARRLDAVRVLLYLLQGAFCDDSCRQAADCLEQATSTVYLLYSLGAFQALCTALMAELGGEFGEAVEPRLSQDESDAPRRRRSATLADNSALRLVLSALCVMAEVLRRDDFSPAGASAAQLDSYRGSRRQFRSDLEQPISGDDTLVTVLFQMVTRFCSVGLAPHYPMRKVLVLLWKALLVWLGGWDELSADKQRRRTAADLAAVEDTVQVARTMRAAPPPPAPPLIAAAQALGARRARPLAQRQLACSGGSGSGDEDDAGLPDETGECDDEVMVDANDQPSSTEKVNNWMDNYNGNDGASVSSSGGESKEAETPSLVRSMVTTGRLRSRAPPPKSLVWQPKIRELDIEAFLERERSKFLDFQLPNDSTTVFGLPRPIHDSVNALRKHVYVSLGELQAAGELKAKREDHLNRYVFSQQETDIEATPAELLYRSLLPHIPQYSIALLKILLAAASSSKAKSDAINILSDVIPPGADAAAIFSTSSSSFSLDAGQTTGLEASLRTSLDINRHKEVIVKAVSSILLLLLKHLRLNHVYQFEYLSQHLVFANCVPLILKFFDQNIQHYIQSKNELLPWNYPAVVVYYSQNANSWPELNASNLESDASADGGDYFLWRNLFSAINLARILNKLVKWKHARTMMLVVFKSAPILKRALRVKQILLQLFALKLLKMQAKYLGRQWRKTNMEIMSAIYSKVRHRLNDDWAFGNETQSKPWEFQPEESQLRGAIERFNRRRYGHLLGAPNATHADDDFDAAALDDGGAAAAALQPDDNDIASVLGGARCPLTDRFKRNYAQWLEREVFRANIDWDQLLLANRGVAH